MPTQNTIIEKHLVITEQEILAYQILSTETGLSKQCIKQAMKKGAVWLTHNKHTRRIRRATSNVKNGDHLHIYYNEHILAATTEAAILISDEGCYSLWNKPYGMYSQGSKWGDHCTINRWVEQNLHPQRPAFIVHRLDRAANGIIIIAHQKRISAAFAELFKSRQIEKTYHAKVHGLFPETMQTINDDIDNRPALSIATLIEHDKNNQQSLLEVTIETGRKHQIRKHLAQLGFPVVGDRLYGNIPSQLNLQLTAYTLSFICPDKDTAVTFHISNIDSPSTQDSLTT